MWRRLTLALLVSGLAACGMDGPPATPVTLTSLSTPAGEGSGEPFLSSHGDAVLMSWLEAVDGGAHELRFAALRDGSWSAPRTIERSEHFFVNWADFPSVSPGPDGTLWAHWLERGPAGGYDYGVRVVRSEDGGASWSEPWTPHLDDSPTEHGFVSALPVEGGMGFVWLDGRKHADGADGTPATGEMTLRYRTMTTDGKPGEETLIDGRVCDCCQTDVAVAASGPVVVYRDRSEMEIRDIYLSRFEDGAWTEGHAVHDDRWHIEGCPVNGPAVTARGDDVAVAWFTGAGNEARVKVAHSSDGGRSFGAPVIVDDGSPAGRVDLLTLEGGDVLVSWLERTGGEVAEVRVRRVASDGAAGESVTLTASSEARASGFPRMAQGPDGAVIAAWTDVQGDAPRVRVQRIELGR